MEHGWVAKHYPRTDQPTISQTNLSDDLEDGSDCESLDSFFNEEFDEREETERLGDLLLCNTLGVESRVSFWHTFKEKSTKLDVDIVPLGTRVTSLIGNIAEP